MTHELGTFGHERHPEVPLRHALAVHHAEERLEFGAKDIRTDFVSPDMIEDGRFCVGHGLC
jgi:hypothetical protein